MKIKELREAIRNAGGQLNLAQGASLIYHGGDVDVKGNGELICWISSGKDEGKDVATEISISTDAIKHIGALGSFAQYVGIPVAGVEPITVEKQVVVQDTKKDEDLVRTKTDYQRSENERDAEKRVYQWVVSELADKLRS